MSTMFLGIILFMTRGMIVNLIFGPKQKRKRVVALNRDTNIYCNACGEDNEPNSAFCVNCGSSFNNIEAAVITK